MCGLFSLSMVTSSNTISLHQVSVVTVVRLSGTTGNTCRESERERERIMKEC